MLMIGNGLWMSNSSCNDDEEYDDEEEKEEDEKSLKNYGKSLITNIVIFWARGADLWPITFVHLSNAFS